MGRGEALAFARTGLELVDLLPQHISHIDLGGNPAISRSSSKDWSSVKDVLLDVIELDDAGRRDLLASPHISDPVRREVMSLLGFADKDAGFLERPAVTYARSLIDALPDEAVVSGGSNIGPYTIESEIALGGMGAVYLARRTDGKFNQLVALKLLRREYSVGKTREAFQREIEIQSSLEHPNIARILDTGTTDDGIPYIAIEFVAGEPIDEYCFSRNLSLRDRLKLFNRVCDGVAFAHRNLVIHRDIKPGNIIVTDDGTPKLIDFGISKLADADQKEPTLFGAMTPEYASPEQIDGRPVTTATDIYSLAVVLYKLVAGRLPFDLSARSAIEARTIVCETEPPLPSSRANSRGVAASQLKGDIDNILLLAMRKDPSERYQTVEQFADDIWRSIDGLPVNARPSTWTYRAARFVRRNRIAAAAGIVVTIALIGGTALALWQSRVAMAEAANAKAEQAKSEKMAKYMAKIIGYANPGWYAEGAKQKGEARVIDAVNELSDKIDADFPNDIDIAAELHYRFGEVFGWVARGKPEGDEKSRYSAKSREHALRALELRVKYYGDWHVLVAKDLYSTFAMLSDDPYEQCRLFDRSINMMRSTDPTNRNFPFMLTDYAAFISYYEDHARTVPCRQTITPVTSESPHEVAVRYYRESIPYLKMHFPDDPAPIAYAECRMGISLARQGRTEEARALRSRCQAFVESALYDPVRRSRINDLELIDSILSGSGS